MSTAFSAMLGHPAVAVLFTPAAVLQAMLDFERALVESQAELGLVDPAHAQTVAHCCNAPLGPAEAQALVEQAAVAGSLAIPLVRLLKDRVGRRDAQALAAAHWGATSQDLIDTAMALQGRQAVALIDGLLRRVLSAIVELRHRHGQAAILAHTLMQPALPSVFEARLLNWALPLARCRVQLRDRAAAALTLQLAGPVGVAGAWGQRAPALRQAVATRLALGLDDWAWHAQRDEVARLASELGVVSGALAKVAIDVALMSQGAVGEMHESQGPGRGASSAMAHKRNPVGAMVALSALQRAPQRVAAIIGCMAQSQERALGPWQAEGAELADLLGIVAGSAAAMADALEHATIDEQRMAGHVRSFAAEHGLPEEPADGLAPQRGALWARLDEQLRQ